MTRRRGRTARECPTSRCVLQYTCPVKRLRPTRNTWIRMAAGNSQAASKYSIRVHLTIGFLLYESNGLTSVCSVPESVTALSRGSWRMLNVHLCAPCLLPWSWCGWVCQLSWAGGRLLLSLVGRQASPSSPILVQTPSSNRYENCYKLLDLDDLRVITEGKVNC